MTISKVYFDMDGVLADFDRGVRELAHVEMRARYGARLPGDDTYMWEAIRKVGHFYAKLEMMPGAAEMFSLVHHRFGERCEILTGIPKPERGIPDAGQDKMEWVRENLSDRIRVNIVYKKDKPLFCTDSGCVLIDDLERTILLWREAGGIGILHTDASSTLAELRTLGIL